MNSLQLPSPPLVLPGPFEYWIAVAVEGLAPEPEAQLREEYHAHIADALERTQADGKDEAAAVEEILQSLGDPKIARERLNREHLTKLDLRWIEKTTSEPGWLNSRKRRSAFYVFFVALSLLDFNGWTSNIPRLASSCIFITSMGLLSEFSEGSVRRRLLAGSLMAPVFILWIGINMIYIDAITTDLQILFSSLCAFFCSILSHRALKLLMKIRRVAASKLDEPLRDAR